MFFMKRILIVVFSLVCAALNVNAMQVALFDQLNQQIRINVLNQLVNRTSFGDPVLLVFHPGAQVANCVFPRTYYNSVELKCGAILAEAEQQQEITNYCNRYKDNYSTSSAKISSYVNKPSTVAEVFRENHTVSIFAQQLAIFDEIKVGGSNYVPLLDETNNLVYISGHNELGCGKGFTREVYLLFSHANDKEKYCVVTLFCGLEPATQIEQRAICDFLCRFNGVTPFNKLFSKQLSIMDCGFFQQRALSCTPILDFRDNVNYDLPTLDDESLSRSNSKEKRSESANLGLFSSLDDPAPFKVCELEDDGFFDCMKK